MDEKDRFDEFHERPDILGYIPKSFLTYVVSILVSFGIGYGFNKLRVADIQKEQFGICRRAIERKYGVDQEEAKKLLEYERKWEDR